MTIKASNFPTVRPTLDLNFARTKRLDPRVTFSRSSSGTYFDNTGLLRSAGTNQARFDHDPATGESLGLLVEEARTNGQTYSERFDNSTWGKSNGVIVSPESGLAPDNTCTADKLIPVNGNRFTALIGSASYVNGTTYSFSVFVKKAGARYAAVAFGGGNQAVSGLTIDLDTGVGTVFVRSGYISILSSGVQVLPNGWYRIHAVATRGNYWTDQIRIYASTSNIDGSTVNTITGDGSSGVLIWGAQLEAGSFPTSYIPTPATFTSRSTTATYYNASGIIQTAGINVARSDAYFPDSNGVMKPAGLLLEAAGTNLLLHSTDFSATWNGSTNGSLTLNATTSPDGTVNAALFASDGLDSFFLGKGLFQTFTSIPAGTTVTASVFVKNNNADTIEIGLGSLNNRFATASFNFSTQQFAFADGGRGSSMSGTYITFPNGWTRLSFTITTIDIGIARILLCPDNGLTTNSVYVYGAQLEASPYPTSYIPTTTSTVTRAADVSTSATVTRSADVAQITGTNFSSWYNQSESSLLVNWVARAPNISTPTYGLFGLGSNDNGVQALCRTTSFDILIQNRSDGQGDIALQAYTNSGPPQNVPLRLALGYQSGAHAVATEGVIRATSASQTFEVVSSLSIGTSLYLSKKLNGTISRLTYYPVRLPDATLQTLTL